jgi:hypothetical protein
LIRTEQLRVSLTLSIERALSRRISPAFFVV